MRLTMKIATSGTAGLSRFPVPDATIDECTDENGRFAEVRRRAAAAGCKPADIMAEALTRGRLN